MASTHIDILLSGVLDNSGNQLANGLVYAYAPGTTCTCHIYQCSSPCVAHCVPAQLDAYGRLTAYADKKLKLVIKDSDCTVIRTLDNLNYVAPSTPDFTANGDCTAAGRAIGNTCAYNFSLMTNNKCYFDVGSDGRMSIDTRATPMHTKVTALSVYDATTCTVARLHYKATGNNVATAYDLWSNGGNANFRNWRIVANQTECGYLSIYKSSATGTAPTQLVATINRSGYIGVNLPDPCNFLHVLGDIIAGGASCNGQTANGDLFVRDTANCIGARFAANANSYIKGGFLAVRHTVPCHELSVGGSVALCGKSARPARPCNNLGVMWVSDGTCLGDCGDIMIASTIGGCTLVCTLFDFSSGATW